MIKRKIQLSYNYENKNKTTFKKKDHYSQRKTKYDPFM